MIFFKKSVNQVFFAFIFIWFFLRPEAILGKVFDRVVAKVNSEIITLSAIEERVLVLKQKYDAGVTQIDEKEILNQALEMIIAE